MLTFIVILVHSLYGNHVFSNCVYIWDFLLLDIFRLEKIEYNCLALIQMIHHDGALFSNIFENLLLIVNQSYSFLKRRIK